MQPGVVYMRALLWLFGYNVRAVIIQTTHSYQDRRKYGELSNEKGGSGVLGGHLSALAGALQKTTGSPGRVAVAMDAANEQASMPLEPRPSI